MSQKWDLTKFIRGFTFEKKQIAMKNFNQKFNLRKVTLALLITLAACQQNEEPTKVAKTKEELIGTTFKADLALIEKATLEVDQLKYQLPQNKGKALNEISFEDYQQTIINRVAVDKGEDVVRVYNALNKNQNYQNVILAQTKALTILDSQLSNAKTATDINLTAVLSPFDAELDKGQSSDKYKEYVRSLKESLISSLRSHLEEIEKTAKIENGEKVISNYDSKALSTLLSSKIAAIENSILVDKEISDDEKKALLVATTIANKQGLVLADLLSNSGNNSGGRIAGFWKVFAKIAAVVVAVGAVVVTAGIASAILTPLLYTGATTLLAVGATIGNAIAVSAISKVVGSCIGGKIYCAERPDCQNCDSFGLAASVYNCF